MGRRGAGVSPLAWLLVVGGKRVCVGEGSGLLSEEGMGPLDGSPLITHDYKSASGSTWPADTIQVLLEALTQETVCRFTSLQTSVTTATHWEGDNVNSQQEELIRMTLDGGRAHLPVRWSNPHLYPALWVLQVGDDSIRKGPRHDKGKYIMSKPILALPRIGQQRLLCLFQTFTCVRGNQKRAAAVRGAAAARASPSRTSLCSCVNPHTQKLSWRLQWQLQVSQNTCGIVIRNVSAEIFE